MSFERLRTVNHTLCDETREFESELFITRVCVEMMKAESVLVFRISRTFDVY
jgi:hypothetical protein